MILPSSWTLIPSKSGCLFYAATKSSASLRASNLVVRQQWRHLPPSSLIWSSNSSKPLVNFIIAERFFSCPPARGAQIFQVNSRTRIIEGSKSSLIQRGASTAASAVAPLENESLQDEAHDKVRPQDQTALKKSVPLLGSVGKRPRTLGASWTKSATEPKLESESEGRKYKSDLVVVLDMDECLIHSVFQSASDDLEQFRQYEAERAHKQQQHEDYRKWSTTPATSSDDGDSLYHDGLDREVALTVEKFQVTLPDGEGVLVHQRPHLNPFLAEVCRTFETHIFTAAMPVYAKPVLDVLERQAKKVCSDTAESEPLFSQRWYRDQCTIHRDLGVYVKDLKRVLANNPPESGSEQNDGREIFNEKRTVLIDNNPMSFLANPCNGILVSNFYDDPSDDTLPAVLELLHELDGLEDVRPKLRELFGLADALSQVVSKKSYSSGGSTRKRGGSILGHRRQNEMSRQSDGGASSKGKSS
jgi:TFIIF-interacting CTD phosphatase-like protein